MRTQRFRLIVGIFVVALVVGVALSTNQVVEAAGEVSR